MAKKKEALRVVLVFDIDDYTKGLARARAQGTAQGKAIEEAVGNAAAKAADRFLIFDRAIKIAEKGLKAFVATAEKLEKEDRGNEGTAAVVRLNEELSRLWENFVRSTLEMRPVAATIEALTVSTTMAADGWRDMGAAIDLALAAIKRGVAEVLGLLNTLPSGVETALRGVEAAVTIAGGPLAGMAFAGATEGIGDPAVVEQAIGNMVRDAEQQSNAAMDRIADNIAREAEARAKAMNEKMSKGTTAWEHGDIFTSWIKGIAKQAEGGERLAAEAAEAAAIKEQSFQDHTSGVVDAFVGSWEGGFAALGDHFRNFSVRLSETFTFMKASTIKGLGSVFDSIAFTGPLLQRVFGQSEAAAQAFQTAEMARVGLMAAVKGTIEMAEAWAETGKGNAGAAMAHITAAGGYFLGAGLAGYEAAGIAGGGGFSGSSIDNATSDTGRFSDRRQNVTVILQNVVGAEEFVRREVIPEINKAVRDDVVVLSSAQR